jgi:hypothetical protein
MRDIPAGQGPSKRGTVTIEEAFMTSMRLGVALLIGAVAAGFLPLGVVEAAAEYGNAVVEQGAMTVTREGKSVTHQASARAVAINEQDLVRVRDASRVTLKTREGATLTIGANAVFQCEPWQAEHQSGMFRMLFGRLQADVRLKAGERNFAVKTRTATIGVKGTVYALAETSNGNTAVVGVEGTTALAGSRGGEQWIGPQQLSLVVGEGAATASVPVPEELKRELASLNSAPLGSAGALELPAEAVLVDKGIVSKEALVRSKEDKERILTPKGLPNLPFPSLNLDDAGRGSR